MRSESYAEKAFSEYDSLRIDHPHGLVCPWVYRDSLDHGLAVRHGSRLHESPDMPDLARYAIARADQLDVSQPRYADHWVRSLDVEQVARYATYINEIVSRAH